MFWEELIACFSFTTICAHDMTGRATLQYECVMESTKQHYTFELYKT
jgi:hypothetical protein